MKQVLNHIDGEMRPARSGNTIDVFEPATGQQYANLAASDAADVDDAIAAARQAFPSWSALSSEQRAVYLGRIADEIESRLGEFAAAESMDTGKPLDLATEVDIPRAVSNLRFFASAATQFASESHNMGDHAINYTLRQPLGAVACISPWNLPLYLFTWKIAPALAVGNTVIGKPSEVTPLTASMLGEACIEAGLPAGVLNIVQGEGGAAGAALTGHPEIKALSFTGSTATGKTIAEILAPRFTKVSLEMGGKNPVLVFADCDIEKAADTVVRSAFTNQGQICLCGSRVLVEDSIYESFRDALLERTLDLKAGDPGQAGTRLGAVVSQSHFDKINYYLDLAQQEGGKLLCGGPVKLEGRCSGGWFIEPVWIEGLGNNCRTNQEEIFGPVASLQRFNDETEALALANQSDYGLACSIWSSDISRCHRLAARIEAGVVWVNCWMQRDLRTPFGGMKASGVGREGGLEALRFFTEPRNVCIEYGQD
jgi:aminomuconate-semialdehyde/2-hydroxymuconate-6-semialdehyde dehydrogenase